MSPVAGVVVVVVPDVVVRVLSRLVAVVSVPAVLLVPFASTRAVLVVPFASTLAVLVEGDAGALVLPVALAVVVFGPFEVCDTFVVFGPDVFGPDVFGPAVVVFGDDTLPFDDTCCGFGVDPFLPCAGSDADEATTNATVETNAINVRVMDPPEGPNAPFAWEVQAVFHGR